MSGRSGRLPGVSRMLFASVFIALGVFYFLSADSAQTLQAVPHWFPGRGVWIAWVYASGIVMLATGAGLLLVRTVVVASRVLLVYLLLSLLLLKLPILVAAPLAIVSWETFAETATLIAGTWVIVATLGEARRSPWLKFAAGESGVRLARILFGIALVLFGLAHFGYLTYTAALVPPWLPWHPGWVCVTGAGYIAAGAGIIFRVYPRLAAALTAGMMSVFQLLIWVPAVVSVPTNQDRWSELLVGLGLAFSAWIVADSYRGVAWLAIGNSSRTEARPRSRTATSG